MRVLVVSHYFPPETGAPQARLSELANAWVASGDDVTILTGMPNHPTGIVPSGYRRRARLEERVDGCRVVRTWLYATPNEGVVKKTLGHVSFMVSAVVLGARRIGPTDVVIVSSPTFFSIFAAWFLALRRRARLVVEVRDLWPAIFVELGVIRDRTLIRVLEALELAAYRAADAVVVVSEGFRRDLVGRGVPTAKVHVIPNGADLELFGGVVSDAEEIRSRLGVRPGETLVCYLGAHGISQDLDTVVDAAAKLEGEPVRFALIGEGAARAHLAERVAEMGLGNVTMYGGVPRTDVPGLLGAADICLVPLRDVPLFSSFIPSKLFEYLAASKAVIGALHGEAAGILAAAGGVVVAPGATGPLAEAIRDLAEDPDRRAVMGRRARAFVTEHYDRRAQAERYRLLLLELIGRAD